MAILLIVALLLATVVVYAAFAALPTWWLWNHLVPQLFGLPPVTFWQAFGLLLLCGFLFKGGVNSSSSSSK